MSIDFYYALLIGWNILLIFWIIILLFIFLRKPPKSKLTIQLIIKSVMVFGFGYLVLIFFN
jgi:hypothetical protein